MPEVFISFPSLKDYGIPWSRPHLNTLMDEGIFPPAQRLSANRIGWSRASVSLFLATRPLSGEPMPRLWPRRERVVKTADPAKPVGRPPGSKVVLGPDGRRRLVRPEELRGAGDAA